MKKIIIGLSLLLTVLISNNTFAQTDSIYTLNAKFENSHFIADFNTNFIPDLNTSVKLFVYDSLGNQLASYLGYYSGNDSFVTKDNATFSSSNFLNKKKIYLNATLGQSIISKAYKFVVIMKDTPTLQTTNELFFLNKHTITSIEELNTVELINKIDRFFSLDGKELDIKPQFGLYILISYDNKKNILERKVICNEE